MGRSTYDLTDPVGRLLFNVLGRDVRRESERTTHGQAAQAYEDAAETPAGLHDDSEHTQAELADLFQVSRTTIYRELQRAAT